MAFDEKVLEDVLHYAECKQPNVWICMFLSCIMVSFWKAEFNPYFMYKRALLELNDSFM